MAAILNSEINLALNKAYESIISESWRNPDWGWGVSPGAPSDAWSTAEIIDLLNNIVVGQFGIIEKSLGRLISLQNQDGGWGASQTESDTTGTALALMTLARINSSMYRDNIKSGLDWLDIHQNSDGGWPLRPITKHAEAHSTMFTTLFSCMAILECDKRQLVPTAMYQRLIPLGQTFLQKARNENGAWGLLTGSPPTARHTGYALHTQYFGLPIDSDINTTVTWLKNHQNPNGSWGEARLGDLESTCWAVIALLDANESPHSRLMTRAINYILHDCQTRKDSLVGWGKEPNGALLTWATYYACMALQKYIVHSESLSRTKAIAQELSAFFEKSSSNWVMVALITLGIIMLYLSLANLVVQFDNELKLLGTLLTIGGILWAIVKGNVIKKG